ncbi:MAG: helix-turn-helix domain-containing protein [Armatimonadetes bacterium]|nr:helix-turn-helix domain-containing protein [Armatimonadota bacterium]MDE2206438.1 helix-turn-helix domain-containing protein [Armatimonadota bacterium]
MNVDAQDLLTVEQAAKFLQMSQSSIRSYIRSGQLEAYRVAGKRKVLIAREALMALLKPVVPKAPTGEAPEPSSRSRTDGER